MNKGRIYFNPSANSIIRVEAELFIINKEYSDIILSAITDLEKGMIPVI